MPCTFKKLPSLLRPAPVRSARDRHHGRRSILAAAPLFLIACGHEGVPVTVYVNTVFADDSSREVTVPGVTDSDPSSFDDGLYVYFHWQVAGNHEHPLIVELELDLAAPVETKTGKLLTAAEGDVVAILRIHQQDQAPEEQQVGDAEAVVTYDRLDDGLRHSEGVFWLPAIDGDLYRELAGSWGQEPLPPPDSWPGSGGQGGAGGQGGSSGSGGQGGTGGDPCAYNSCPPPPKKPSSGSGGGCSGSSSGGCTSGSSGGCTSSDNGGCSGDSGGSGCSGDSGGSGCSGDSGGSGCSGDSGGSGCSGDSGGSGCGSGSSSCAGDAYGGSEDGDQALGFFDNGSGGSQRTTAVESLRPTQCRPGSRRNWDLFLLIAPFVLIAIRLHRFFATVQMRSG